MDNMLSQFAEIALAKQQGFLDLKAGEVLFEEGESSDKVYLLVAGELKVYSCTSNGREVVYNVVQPGELVGDLALDGGVRSASVRASVDSRCMSLARKELTDLVREHPDVSERLLLSLMARLRTATGKIRSLAFEGVYERVVALLEENAAGDGAVRQIPRHLTQTEIASRIGSTREMVNHVMRELERGGFIDKSNGRQIMLLNRLPRRW